MQDNDFIGTLPVGYHASAVGALALSNASIVRARNNRFNHRLNRMFWSSIPWISILDLANNS
jgi:hypothetical protein